MSRCRHQTSRVCEGAARQAVALSPGQTWPTRSIRRCFEPITRDWAGLAAKIRVHELAKELGLTNKEALDLSLSLGIGVKSHSSGMEGAQADRVRRKADREGLIRDVQPEEPPKVTKKAGSKSAAEPVAEATEVTSSPGVETPSTSPSTGTAAAASPVGVSDEPKRRVDAVHAAEPAVEAAASSGRAEVTTAPPETTTVVPGLAAESAVTVQPSGAASPKSADRGSGTVPGPRPPVESGASTPSAPAGPSRIISSSNRPGSTTAGNRSVAAPSGPPRYGNSQRDKSCPPRHQRP